MSNYSVEIDPQLLATRLSALNTNLSKILNPVDVDEAQYHQAEALFHLISQTALMLKDLAQFFEQKRLDYIALATRNIVELRIWTDHCIKSEENAKMFMYDIAKDGFGLIEAFGRLAPLTPNPEAMTAVVETARESLRAAGQSSDVKVDKNYIRIRDVADVLGPESLTRYQSLNIATSKFVHPTSFVVNMIFPIEMSVNFMRIFNHIALSEANDIADTTETWFKARPN